MTKFHELPEQPSYITLAMLDRPLSSTVVFATTLATVSSVDVAAFKSPAYIFLSVVMVVADVRADVMFMIELWSIWMAWDSNCALKR